MKNLKLKPYHKAMSLDEIEQQKDFNKILEKYQSHILLKTKWIKAGAWVGGISMVLVVLSMLTKEPQSQEVISEGPVIDTTEQFTAYQSEFKAPYSKFDVPFEIFKVSTGKGLYLKSIKGSLIRIPENSFVDSLGNEIEGSFEIHYREFHNPFEIFLAGIPMHYNERREGESLESAGMIELRAYQGEKTLTLKEGKNIEIELVTKVEKDGYKDYYFNEDRNEWTYMNESELAKKSQSFTRIPEDNVLAENFDNQEINSKQEERGKDYFLEIEIDQEKFPEINEKEVLFKVNQDLSIFKDDWYAVVWDEIRLEKSDKEGNYKIEMNKSDTTISVYALPVKLNQSLEKKQNENRKLQEERRRRRKERISKIHGPEYQSATIVEFENAVLQEIMSELQFSSAVRVLNLPNVGIYNCDIPIQVNPNRTTLAVKDLKDKDVQFRQLYLVDLSRNTVFTFGPNGRITYNANSENVIWFIDQNNKMGILPTELTNKKSIKKSQVFKVEMKENIKGLAELKQLLG